MTTGRLIGSAAVALVTACAVATAANAQSPAVQSPPVQSLPERLLSGALPVPSGDPMRIDPAADPVLLLARAQSPVGEFRAAIAGAVLRNPAYDEAEAARQEAIAGRREILARNLPVFDVSLSTFKVLSRGFSSDPGNILERQRPDHRSDATLRVQQTLLDFGANSARIKAGSQRLVAAAAGLEDTRNQLALRAIAAWYGVYGYRTLVGLSDAFVATQRDLRGLVEQRVNQGVAASGDLAQVDSYIASANTQLAEFRRAAAGAEAQFEVAMGAPAPASLGRAPVPDLAGLSRETAAASASRLPAVRAAWAGAEASKDDATAVAADLLPQVSVGVDAGRYGVIETSKDYDVRGNVTLNWRLGGGGIERRDQALARSTAASARARRIEIEARRDATIAWADVAALEDQRAAIEQNYLASRRSRDVLAERFRVSRGTLVDIIGAESNFFSVAARYIQAVTELDTARYILLARTGGLLTALGIEPGTGATP